MPPRTLVLVLEVHAKAIQWNHSLPAAYQLQVRPDTDYSVLMDARSGYLTRASAPAGRFRCRRQAPW